MIMCNISFNSRILQSKDSLMGGVGVTFYKRAVIMLARQNSKIYKINSNRAVMYSNKAVKH